MAGGFKDFTAATALSADVDNYLMRQTIMRFASTAARDSALSGNLEDGMFCMTLDTHSIFYYNGSAWIPFNTPWTTYTPSWTNLTVNSGTVNFAKYRYSAGDFRCRGQLTFAADTSVTGTIFQTIPNSVTADAGFQGGTGLANDVGTRIYPLVVAATISSTTFSWFTDVTGGNVNATVPFAWGNTDVLTWDLTVGV